MREGSEGAEWGARHGSKWNMHHMGVELISLGPAKGYRKAVGREGKVCTGKVLGGFEGRVRQDVRETGKGEEGDEEHGPQCGVERNGEVKQGEDGEQDFRSHRSRLGGRDIGGPRDAFDGELSKEVLGQWGIEPY